MDLLGPQKWDWEYISDLTMAQGTRGGADIYFCFWWPNVSIATSAERIWFIYMMA